MSAGRKLQTEIQQVMKKVEEGLVLFDDFFEKVYAAREQNLREKYEGDLKKEIKKLQRLRDQVKNWLSNPDIKDKAALETARRTIETKMEQFKICEKDTKLKSFPKDGISRDAKEDPKEEERNEKRNWLNSCVERLETLIETITADMEKTVSKSKGKNKEQVELFENRLRKNRWHISKLEGILNYIDNLDFDPSRLDSIKDDVEFYIESASDDDGALGIDDEFDVYEELQLDSMNSEDLDQESSVGVTETKVPVKNDLEIDIVKIGIPKKVSLLPATAPSPSAAAVKLPIATKPAPAGKPAPAAALVAGVKGSTISSATNPPITAAAKFAASLAEVSLSTNLQNYKSDESESSKLATSLSTPQQKNEAAKHSITMAHEMEEIKSAPILASTTVSENILASVETVVPAVDSKILIGDENPTILANPSSITSATATQQLLQLTAASTSDSQSQANVESQAIKMTLTQPVAPLPASSVTVATSPEAKILTNSQAQLRATSSSYVSLPTTTVTSSIVSTLQPNQTSSLTLNPTLSLMPQNLVPSAVAPNAQKPNLVTSNPETTAALNMLRWSMVFSPESADPDKQSYVPKNPYNYSHSSYPTQPPTQQENIALFEKLPIDTLFFAFYYQPGTHAQYLAAKQLKSNSWRFHKKYMTWFQRHEEPKVSTDEYEEGSYCYFDYESSWCQRIKADFKFEYSFLEDELPTG